MWLGVKKQGVFPYTKICKLLDKVRMERKQKILIWENANSNGSLEYKKWKIIKISHSNNDMSHTKDKKL